MPPAPRLSLLWCCALGVACATAAVFAAATAHGHKPIKRVSLLFACHLDVGFHSGGWEPGYDNAVISRYFNEHYPRAIRLAQELRDRGVPERYVFLTHSWLVSLFLDCPARIGIRCPDAATVDEFKAAVKRGDITWHALPHNGQIELYDADLLAYGVRMAHDLDRAFGLPPKAAASQRDVPGLTRAAIPVLAFQGVKAISVGVNGGSAPPAVPKNTPFIWRDDASGSQLLAMWHPGGYSGFPVDSRDQCVQADGLRHAMCFAWTGDNTGPHTVAQVLDIFERVRRNFPGADVAAAGLEGFVAELVDKAGELDLPVVTGEIGDTWIYGAASDPAKLSEYRALLRMRAASRERYDDAAFQRFSRLLLKLPEHTWGTDTKQHPGDYTHWTNKDFQAQLGQKGADNPFAIAVASWVRQRAYSLWAVQELGSSEAGVQAWEVLAALQDGKAPPQPGAANSSFKRCSLDDALLFESDSWQLELSKLTGAITGLRFKGSKGSLGSSSSSSNVGMARGNNLGRGRGKGGAVTSLWQRLLGMLRLPGAFWRGAAVRDAKSDNCTAGTGGSSCGGGGAAAQPSFASFDAPLALPVYSTYSEDDYEQIWDTYAYAAPHLQAWFRKDFGKPNTTALGGARRAEYLPQAQEVWWKKDAHGLHVVVKATFDSFAMQQAGAPRAVWTEIRAPAGSGDLLLDVTWEDKTPTRLPEAFWLRWKPDPAAVNTSSWLMWKLGRPISPLEVVQNGSQAQHAVGDEGVSVDSADSRRRLFIRSLDAAVVSPGRATPFPTIRDPPDLRLGMSHCLTNNIWGTNYVMWHPYQKGDASMRFRFIMQLQDLQLDPQQPAAAEEPPSTAALTIQ